MDKVERYRALIRELLLPITQRRYSGLDVVNEAVFDTEHDRYLVVSVGWEGYVRRIHHVIVQLDIINDKIWIQQDRTEDGVGYDIEAAGVPKSDIVPAFHPEYIRPHTGYAVA